MAEYKFREKFRAEMVLGLMGQVEGNGGDYPLKYYVDAARDFDSLESAISFLDKECSICYMGYPIHEVRLVRRQ